MAEDGTTTIAVDGQEQIFAGGFGGRVLAFHAAAAALADPDEEPHEALPSGSAPNTGSAERR